jgi:hypothetical protein
MLPLALAPLLWIGILYLPGWTLATVLTVLAWAAWPQPSRVRR